MGDGLSAVALGTGKSAAAIAAGWGHTCAVLDDGGLKVRSIYFVRNKYMVLLYDLDSFRRRVRALVRAGTSEVVDTHSVLPQGDPVLASLAHPFERAGRFAAI